MLFLILFLIIGIGLGLSIRKLSLFLKTSEKVVTLLLYSFLFFAGILTGIDDMVVSNINSIGWKTFVLVIVSFAISIVIFRLIYKRLIQVRRCR